MVVHRRGSSRGRLDSGEVPRASITSRLRPRDLDLASMVGTTVFSAGALSRRSLLQELFSDARWKIRAPHKPKAQGGSRVAVLALAQLSVVLSDPKTNATIADARLTNHPSSGNFHRPNRNGRIAVEAHPSLLALSISQRSEASRSADESKLVRTA